MCANSGKRRGRAPRSRRSGRSRHRPTRASLPPVSPLPPCRTACGPPSSLGRPSSLVPCAAGSGPLASSPVAVLAPRVRPCTARRRPARAPCDRPTGDSAAPLRFAGEIIPRGTRDQRGGSSIVTESESQRACTTPLASCAASLAPLAGSGPNPALLGRPAATSLQPFPLGFGRRLCMPRLATPHSSASGASRPWLLTYIPVLFVARPLARLAIGARCQASSSSSCTLGR